MRYCAVTTTLRDVVVLGIEVEVRPGGDPPVAG
jgi:hypothetical protein